MNLKSYFDVELRTTVVYAVIAVIMGYVSMTINNTAMAALVAIIVLVILTFVLRAVFKIKEGAKWWMGNGVIVYLFLWVIVWTIFYNTYII
ncbi:MAG TPA: hypothetical protein HA230_02900 [Candidatus Aenigmarchaeota archaeon]|nr:hypothetical protein [Candidatus Aenigmarchaeota archaeon]